MSYLQESNRIIARANLLQEKNYSAIFTFIFNSLVDRFKIMRFVTIFILLNVFPITRCIAQSESADLSKNFSIGIRLNSITNDYPDQYNTNNSGMPWIDQFELYAGNDKDKSLSIGISFQYVLGIAFLRLRFDRTKIDVSTDNVYETTTFTEFSFSSKKRTDFQLAPGVGWTVQANHLTVLAGFEIPMVFRGDGTVHRNVEDHDTSGQIIYSQILNGEINYGNSFGAGIFVGFEYSFIKSRLFLGGELASSFAFYKNIGFSTFRGSDSNGEFIYSDKNDSYIQGFTAPTCSFFIKYSF